MNQFNQDMDIVKVHEVIISTNMRRGLGTDSDPMRIITQIWTKDGILIAEIDPHKSN